MPVSCALAHITRVPPLIVVLGYFIAEALGRSPTGPTA